MTEIKIKQAETSTLIVSETLKTKYNKSEIERTCKYIKRFGLQIPIVINQKQEIVFLEL